MKIINHPPTLQYLESLYDYNYIILFMLLSVLTMFFLRNRSNKIRTHTSAQKKKFKEAQKYAKKALNIKISPNSIAFSMDGFVYELFVLIAFQRSHPNIRYMFPIKLTADKGIDGAFCIGDTLYIIQTKRYKGLVRTIDIEKIGKKAKTFETSTHPYAIKQRARYRYDKVKPFFVTTGLVNNNGKEMGKKYGVIFLGHIDVIRLIRKELKLIN